MRKLSAPAILIPATLLLCGLTTLWVPGGTELRFFMSILLYIFVAFWVGVFAHEVGHLAGARLAEFRVLAFVVGPLIVVRNETGRYRLRLNMNPALTAGLVQAMPLEFVNLRWRRFWFIVCGPLASLLFGLFFMVTGLGTLDRLKPLMPKGISAANFGFWWFGGFQCVIGALSLFLFFISAIPHRTKKLPSDGFHIIRLLQGGPRVDRDNLIMELGSFLIARKRPRQFPADLVEKATALQDNTSEQLVAVYFAYLNAIDLDQIERADQYIDQIKKLRPKGSLAVQIEIAYAIAVHEAFYRQNAELARRWVNLANQKNRVENLLSCQTNAIVLFAEGKPEEATVQLEKTMTLLEPVFKLGGDIADYAREGIEEIKQRYVTNTTHPESEVEGSTNNGD